MTGLTRTRIVALVLIGLAFLGLAYIKVASADEAVSVPPGALAGDLLLHPLFHRGRQLRGHRVHLGWRPTRRRLARRAR